MSVNSLINQTCHLQYRIQTFEGSPFERLRGKCSPKRMAEAGFYYPKEQPPNYNDMVRCYACGVELYGWNRASDDPWNEHERENPNCCYLLKKKAYTKELELVDFVEIEKYRYMRLNDNLCNGNSDQITKMLSGLGSMSEEEIRTLHRQVIKCD